MTSNFVVLSESDFIDWGEQMFGCFELTSPKNGRERVIRHDLQIHGLELHIYTSVEPSNQQTREKGEDAIRLVLYDRWAGKAVTSAQKVLRVEGQTTVWERLTQRVEELKSVAREMERKDLFCKCSSHRVHSVKRTNSKNGSTFYGCSLFPLCNQARFNKLQHAAKNYPLSLNPLKEFLPVETPVPVVEVETMIREKITGDFVKWPVNVEEPLVPTQNFPLTRYPFEYFNCVQSTVLKSEVWKRDVNLILGTATSSGKTICAELAIAAALRELS